MNSSDFIIKRQKIQAQLITDENPFNGILKREFEKGNIVMEASSTSNGNVYDLIKDDTNSDFNTDSKPNSWISATIKNKSMIINKYAIRGRKYERKDHQLQSWKIEVQRQSDKQWIEVDKHENECFDKLQVRTFPINYTEPIIAIKLTQIGKDSWGYDYLCINAFEIFGYLLKDN